MANVRSRVEYLISARDKATAVFNKSSSRIGAAMAKVGRIAKVGAVATAALGVAAVALAKKLTASSDALAKFVKRGQALGFTADEFIGITQAVEDSGGSIKKAEIAMRTMTKTMAEADAGMMSYKRAYDGLGISLRDTDGKLRSQGDVLNDIIDTLAASENATEHAANANYIFGRNWLDIMRIAQMGEGVFRRYTESVEKLGLSVDQELLAKSEDAQDRLTILGKIVKNQTAHSFSKYLAPTVAKVATALATMSAGVRTSGTSFIELGEAFLKSSLLGRPLLLLIHGITGAIKATIVSLTTAGKLLVAVLNPLSYEGGIKGLIGRLKDIGREHAEATKKVVVDTGKAIASTMDESLTESAIKAKALFEGVADGAATAAEGLNDRLIFQNKADKQRLHDEEQAEILAAAEEEHQAAAKAQTRMLARLKEEEDAHKRHGGIMLGVAKKQASALAAHSKKAAKVQQAIRIAEAIREGWAAAVSSYEWGAKTGGPPLGAAMAALSLAATGAYVKQLGGSQDAGGTVSGAPLGSAAEPITTQPAFGVGGEGGAERIVTINVQGKSFDNAQVVELVEAINEEMGDQSLRLEIGARP